MQRKPLAIANWKMNTTIAEATVLAKRVQTLAEQIADVHVVLLPPVIWLPHLRETLHHRPKTLHFGVQNFYPKEEGAYTGEIGIKMIEHLAEYVLIGHSERRTVLGETHELIAAKVKAAFHAGLKPILCVGELTKVMLTERGRGRPTVIQRESDLFKQLDSALDSVSPRHAADLTVAYEPLWAIGSGNHVSGGHAQAVLAEIRGWLVKRYGLDAASQIHLVYGGSVTEQSIHEYTKQPDVDGVLVGGASLEIRRFAPIVEALADRAHHQVHHIEH